MDNAQRLTNSESDEGRYRLLLEAITDYAIYMIDPDGTVTNWNAGAQRFKGYMPHEIIGQHFSRFYSEEDRASGLPMAALRIAREEGKFESEGWRLRKNGEPFWAHVVIDPIWADDGSLIGFAKITRDLTERKRAIETLRHSEEQFRLLVQSVTDYAIYRLDSEGNVVSWNAGAERIKGYKAHEVIGSHFSRFYTEKDRVGGEPQRALENTRQFGRFAAEGWRVRKDGSLFRASVVIDAIYDDDGELIGFAKITRDVTEREETQRQLDAAREALFQSQKMEAIGQLTGGVAHDFNNLLMAIQSSLTLLKKRHNDPGALKLIDNAIQGVERGSALTQRMLAFARRQDLKSEHIDIPKLVLGMTELLQRTLGPRFPINLRFQLCLPPVFADANQVEMAIINLAVNARDAMPDGGSIMIAATEEEVGTGAFDGLNRGSYVKLSVTDNGVGMDAATLARATEPFFTTKGIGKGTGLGLSMIHGLAEQLCGTLMLHSEPGNGTTAELWLPIAARIPIGEAPAFMPPPARVEPSRPLRIVAVDDDSLVLMNTAALLEDLGHSVIEANSGADAVAYVRDNPDIDLLITDQAMPAMTGIQLVGQLAQDYPDLPIILATGYAELPADGPSGIIRLGKPFTQEQLAAAIQTAMEKAL